MLEDLKTIGTNQDINIYYAELHAIYIAVDKAVEQQIRAPWAPPGSLTTVYTDSQAAVRSLQKPRHQSGQHLIRWIIQRIDELKTRFDITVVLRWVPAYKGVKGNKAANKIAKQATKEGSVPQLPNYRLRSSTWRWAKTSIDKNKFYNACTSGRFTRTIDQALLGPYTKKLYNELN